MTQKEKAKLVPVSREPALLTERDADKSPVLECIDLGITFGGLKAVDNFNVTIGRTEITGLIGPNGAGKTTVFNLLTKVYQPSRESVILGFRTKQGARKLLISAAPSSARVHMTQVAVDNPAKPPMFCMLLRKHLTGGRLIAIRQDGLERILFLDFQCTNELGDSVVITLACEIMGRCSNLVVIRQDGTILDWSDLSLPYPGSVWYCRV